ncbi:hypothetical protein [Halarcobacter sp.]|uniref:hypothetical protein n=1 Tax=Halarcobacter sp. TaxID=2321133 RepID=UPI002AABD8BD|nr:hypothetical protein [Halarcobacter sp.]
MTLVSNKTTKKIFLTTNTKVNNITDKVSLIISPEFYWVRKFDIPVKTETQARHLLPTLFEDLIKENDSLTYQAIKLEENLFLCFAYSDKKIYEAIKKANIPISNISSVYFAQNECKKFESFEVDEQNYIYTRDGILVKIPNSIAKDSIVLNKVINNIKLSSYKLHIKLYNNFFNIKFYYSIFAVLSILILMNLIKYINYSSEISTLNNQVEEIRKNYNLPSSSLQVRSILSKYNKSISLEKEKRDAISYILSNNKLNLKSLAVDNNLIILEYISTKKAEVDSFLKKKFKAVNIKENQFLLKVSITL